MNDLYDKWVQPLLSCSTSVIVFWLPPALLPADYLDQVCWVNLNLESPDLINLQQPDQKGLKSS